MSDELQGPGRRSLLTTSIRVLGILAAVGFVLLLVFGLVAKSPNTSIDDALAKANAIAAPGFTLDVLERGRPPARLRGVSARATADGRVSLSELRGTPVVLNLWASWCDPCRVEAPVLERAARRAGRQGVAFVGLDMQDASGDAREFLRRFRISYLNVRDTGKATARSYGATGIPETFFISRRGEVVGHVIGALDDTQAREGVRVALAGRPRQVEQGGDRRATR